MKFHKVLCVSAALTGAVTGVTAVFAVDPSEQSASMPPKPTSEMQSVLDSLAALHPKPIETLSAEEARQQPSAADAVKALMAKKNMDSKPMPVGKITEVSVDGFGGPIPVRVYFPTVTGNEAPAGPLPVLVYIHGGGWVLATNDTYDASYRAMCNAANCIVVAPEYRKAPEHKFPAAHDDVYAVTQWAMKTAGEWGGDAKRVAIAGESAGGNMAAATCLTAKRRGEPMPVAQILIYPVADSDMTRPSYQRNADAKPLNKAMMKWFFEKTTSSPSDADDARLKLVTADVAGLPPATVITAEIDPLMSEGKALAEHLQSAGVPVRYKNFDGVTHEFFGMAAVVPTAKEAQKFAAQGLNEAFAKKQQP